jgi:hypothetical protein
MLRRLAILAGISMIVGGVLWFTMPERREAFALVRINAIQPGVLPTPLYDPVEFGTFKRTQAQLVKSGMVIRATLRDPAIMPLKIVKAKEDPVEWLTGKLTVDFPEDGEIMRIGLRGENPIGAVKLVDAVVNKYMSEIVGEQKSRDAAHSQMTEKQYGILSDECNRAAAALAQQEKTRGVAGTPDAMAQKELASRNFDDAISYRNQVRKKVRDLALQIELERAKSQREVKTADEEQQESPGLWELGKERELQETELAAAEESIELSIRALSNLRVSAADLDQERRALQQRQEVLDELGAKLQRERVEQFSQERVTKIDPASIETPASAMTYLGPAILTVCGLALVVFGAWPKVRKHRLTPEVHQA